MLALFLLIFIHLFILYILFPFFIILPSTALTKSVSEIKTLINFNLASIGQSNINLVMAPESDNANFLRFPFLRIICPSLLPNETPRLINCGQIFAKFSKSEGLIPQSVILRSLENKN